MGLLSLTVAATLLNSVSLVSAASGTGTTTRYWDCCKPSCAWDNVAQLGIKTSVTTCDINDNPLSNGPTAKSGCQSGGIGFMCSSQMPWAVSDSLSYGFAAVSASSPKCCQCYELTFTSTAVSGKKMIVQATNTGGDVSSTQFDIAMPGGGFGIFDGCTKEWNANSAVWGAQYGGSSTNTCAQFPAKLQPGCYWRWDWFKGADNPTVQWTEIACPASITAKSGCVRNGDTPTGGNSASTYVPGTGTSSTSAAPPAGTGGGGSGCSVAAYEQCGGTNYSGCTTCAAGTCSVVNEYYHQCLP